MNIKEELLKACPELHTRKLVVSGGVRLDDSIFINFINLPAELESCGAEKENNRMMFSLRPKADGKFQLEHSVNALPREYQLRGKTANMEKLVSYLAQFLRKVIAEVPPKYTHTKIPSDNGLRLLPEVRYE